MIVIESYDQMVGALSARRRALGITLEELSERMGLADRYANKIMCFDRRLGTISWSCLLDALGVQLVAEVIEEPSP